MNLLKTAVNAKCPLIGIHTDDYPAIVAVVENITGKKVHGFKCKPGTVLVNSVINPGQIGLVRDPGEMDFGANYKWLEANGSTLIIVNPLEPDPWIMDLGTVEVPIAMVREYVSLYAEGEIEPLVAALAGLSINNMKRITQLATAEFGEFTPQAIRAIRREFFQVSRGLEEIDPEQVFYEPNDYLKTWLLTEGKLFKMDSHPLLTPRGLLLTGSPGTGKTSGAKYLAHELRVPLYKLDVGMLLGKLVGQSDERLNTALRQADSFEPCILLLDEVEKLFEVDDHSGIVQRLFGHLLWWLQEHKSKVLVIMTTNNRNVIPPELYRAGRIDDVVNFSGLLQTQMLPFITDLAKRLEKLAVLPTETLETLVKELLADSSDIARFSQAYVTEQVLRAIKLQVIAQSKEKSSE